MNDCPYCSGMLYRHDTTYTSAGIECQRFKCKECRKTITVRNGQIVNGRGPRVMDWRTKTSQEKAT